MSRKHMAYKWAQLIAMAVVANNIVGCADQR